MCNLYCEFGCPELRDCVTLSLFKETIMYKNQLSKTSVIYSYPYIQYCSIQYPYHLCPICGM